MLLRLRRRHPSAVTIGRLYGAIVAQARLPVFYLNGVPDTVDGRFDLIVLHLFLLTRRLESEAGEGRALAQALFEHFCRDLDDNLREMGVGDLTVPRRMRSFAEAYFGRAQVYERALASGDDSALAAALARNVFSRDAAVVEAQQLATYIKKAATHLANQQARELVQGLLAFPVPDDVMPATGKTGNA